MNQKKWTTWINPQVKIKNKKQKEKKIERKKKKNNTIILYSIQYNRIQYIAYTERTNRTNRKQAKKRKYFFMCSVYGKTILSS